eukprot:sb/3474984/
MNLSYLKKREYLEDKYIPERVCGIRVNANGCSTTVYFNGLSSYSKIANYRISQRFLVKNSLNLEIIRGKLIFAQSVQILGEERSRGKAEGTRVISVLELVGLEKTKGTRVISVLELVGVGTKIEFLSHLVN